jgi:serine phosphatase RsbU (regulator of sigma subunit)
MSDPVPIRRKVSLRSVNARILRALLALSLLPLILFAGIGRSGMLRLEGRTRSDLIQDAQQSLRRVASDQAAIANAILNKVEVETKLIAFTMESLLRNRSSVGVLRSYSASERPADPNATSVYSIAPGVHAEAVKPDVDLSSNLDNLLVLVRKGDSNLDAVYIGMESGVHRRLPWDSEDDSSFDSRTRPWYMEAAGRREVVWTKYPNWSRGGFRFMLDPELELQIDGKVSAALVQAFQSHAIGLIDGSPINVARHGYWRLQDKNGKNYEIRKADSQFNVYSMDVLTCSHVVLGPDGRPAGVVGLDISMDAMTGHIIHSPEDIDGWAFLLNVQSELIEQEKPDMFVPEAGSAIRQKMTAGATGIAFDSNNRSYVAFAPIPSIHSADGKSFSSLGISMSEHEITRLAGHVQQMTSAAFRLFIAAFAVMIAVVTFAAFRISHGITEPIRKLDHGAVRIGAGDLDYRLDIRTGDEIEELAGTFNKMAVDLKSYIQNLKETTAEKERIESELRVAHDIQMSFLKKIFPPFPERPEFSLYATLEPAKEVGGDLYDFSIIDGNRLVFYIGDVSDKGVPAALVMAMTMTLLKRASQRPGSTPAQILKEVNVAVSEGNENSMFVTLFIGILDFQTGELIFSNAGHNPPLIRRTSGESHFVTLPDGLVLGVMPECEYTDARVNLAPGDMIVAYTDGVTEAMNNERELYSDARLQSKVATLGGASVEYMVTEIVASVKAHAAGVPQSDDISVLALRRS